jgi:hypothetical protein
MRRFRRWRRRAAALALLPATVMTMTTAIGTAGAGTTAPRMSTSDKRVSTGGHVKLRGQFESANRSALAPGETIRDQRRVLIEFTPAGTTRWHRVDTTHSDAEGHYAQRVKVVRSGKFRAVDADGRRSQPERVRAKSRTRARVANKSARVGDKVPIKGRVSPSGSRRRVTVKVGGHRLHTRTTRRGTFKVRWKASGTGNYGVRVKAKGDRIAAGSKDKAGKVTVFRPAAASWYGPGFYGSRTACGQTLTTATMGVANKSMPCGTKLTLRYGGRQVKVEVIDRGPYSGDREFDLTSATKQRLHFPDTGTVLSSK